LFILTNKYIDAYKQQLPAGTGSALQALIAAPPAPRSFTFYTSVAVISSSRIEGEIMETDSYVKHKMQDIEYPPELVEKPNDLFNAYAFAQQHELGLQNFLHAHTLLSAHLLPPKWRGAYRKNEMLVMEHNTGRIQYEAAPYRMGAFMTSLIMPMPNLFY
jgi:hypothetical protein